jgi:hypothetical protein
MAVILPHETTRNGGIYNDRMSQFWMALSCEACESCRKIGSSYDAFRMMDKIEIFRRPEVVQLSRCLLDSYEKLAGQKLIPRYDEVADSEALFSAPFVVVAHGTQTDPILSYGNLTAQRLWEMSWEELTQTPSRLTAEPGAREDRERLLREAQTQGFSRDYRGIRISSSGKRFWIEDVTVWNVLDENGVRIGQAATFSKWRMIQ